VETAGYFFDSSNAIWRTAFLSNRPFSVFLLHFFEQGAGIGGKGNLSARAGRDVADKNDPRFQQDPKQAFSDRHQGWLK
jgi:hypothetical protein